MSLNWPIPGATGETYTYEGNTWVWNGEAWASLGAYIPGPTGPIGFTGPVGPGVPPGGASGTYLMKSSTGDYVTVWAGANDLYTNTSPSTIDVGGIPQYSTFNNRTMDSMWTQLLYPPRTPLVSFEIQSYSGAVYEPGQTFPANRTIRYSVRYIQNLIDFGLEITYAENGWDGSYDEVLYPLSDVLPKPTVDLTQYTSLIASPSKLFMKSAKLSWNLYSTSNTSTSDVVTKVTQVVISCSWKTFFGLSNSATVSSSQVNSNIMNSMLLPAPHKTIAGLYNFPERSTPQYLYFCMPDVYEYDGGTVVADYPPPTGFTDATTGLPVPMATSIDNSDYAYRYDEFGNPLGPAFAKVNITNTFGVVQTYRIYRSKYRISGNITVNVSQVEPSAYLTTGFRVYQSPTPEYYACSLDDADIGTQTWQACNLNVSEYRNGDPIPQVTDPAQWAGLTTGAWCWYNNSTTNGNIYGKLYNWYAVADSRGIGPTGYRVPSASDWDTLGNYVYALSPTGNTGGKLKVAGNTYWFGNVNATNLVDFSAMPGGSRGRTGTFVSLNTNGRWWSSTEVGPTGGVDAYARTINANNSAYLQAINSKKNGFTVRLIKN